MKDLQSNGWTENEIDFTNLAYSSQKWCIKYGEKQSETTSGNSKTTEYKHTPTNRGKSFKFKVRYDYNWKDKDTSADPPRNVEGMYCKARFIHCDSEGQIYCIDEEKEELVFETTLHT